MNNSDETVQQRIDAARAGLARSYAEDPETVQRFEARKANLDAVRRRDRRDRQGWCILQTAPSSTVNLARSLAKSGIKAWTPTRTFKREKPGRCKLIDGKKPTVEIDAPILPGFVFASGFDLEDLVFIASQPVSQHPSYSVFRHGDRYPLVADREVVGLQQAETEAAEQLAVMREVEARDHRKRVRAAAARNERERRKVLRAERRHFAVGAHVAVADVPALAGMTGVVERGDGRSAVIVFGGLLRMTVETWQLVATPL